MKKKKKRKMKMKKKEEVEKEEKGEGEEKEEKEKRGWRGGEGVVVMTGGLSSVTMRVPSPLKTRSINCKHIKVSK